MKRIIWAIWAVCFFAAFAAGAQRPSIPTSSPSRKNQSAEQSDHGKSQPLVISPQELFKELAPTVFIVETFNQQGSLVAFGSAVAVGPRMVVTNRHVIEGGMIVRVRRGRQMWPAEVVRMDADHDLCELSAQGLSAVPVPVRPSSSLAVGERVYAIGAPEGLEVTLSEGLISGLRQLDNVSVIQTTAAISHGSSGGGLFDEQGNLVGITTFFVKEGQNLNFALPGEWVLALKEGFPRTGSQGDAEDSTIQAVAWVLLSINAFKSGDYQQAISAAEGAVHLKPEFPGGWFTLGGGYFATSQNTEAIKALREAVRLKRDFPEAWQALGLVYDEMQQYDQAIAAYQEACHFKPDDPVAWHDLGITYAKAHQFDQAVAAYSKSILLKPDDTKAWYDLGVSYAAQGDRAEVKKVYEHLNTVDAKLAEKFFKEVIHP